MANTNKPAVAVFYESPLNELFFRGLMRSLSMTYYGSASADFNSLEAFRKGHSQISVVIISSEWLNRGADRLIEDIRQHSPKAYIIICCVQRRAAPKEKSLFASLNAANPDTVCYKSELASCLQAWQSGSPFRSPHLWAHLSGLPASFLPGWQNITAAERRVLHLAAEGKSGPDIADMLCISRRTVNNHKTNISRKLNVSAGPGSLVRFVLLNREKILSLVGK